MAGVEVVEEFDKVVGDSWISFEKVEGRTERRSTPRDTVRITWGGGVEVTLGGCGD